MSNYSGAYIGVGYILSEEERVALLAPLVGTEAYDDAMDNFHAYRPDMWFFGKIVYQYDGAEAHSIESLAALPGLQDDGSFGLKYGAILSSCGLSVETINEKWGRPDIYFVHWFDW